MYLTKRSGIIFSICMSLVLITTPIANQEFLHDAFSQTRVYVDNSGVPRVDYGCVGGFYLGEQRNPVTASHHGLSAYAEYNRTKDDVVLEKFLNISDWLVTNAVPKGNYSLLTYLFYWPTYDIQPPWQSGMAQARALEVLGKAYELTNNQTYLDAAKSLLNSFFVEVKDGGVTYKTPNEGWWYEEYARPGVKETRVLNGHTFALLSIYDYYQRTNDHNAKFLFDQGVLALKNNLPNFDFADGQFSTYDNNRSKPNNIKYHLYQTSHLGTLYNITGEEIFKTYFDRWTDFEAPETVKERFGFYDDVSDMDLVFTSIKETEDDKPILRKINESSDESMPAKFVIQGHNGNKTTNFVSQEFYSRLKNITVEIGDWNKPYTNSQISFLVIREGLGDGNNVTFVHGPHDEGWKDNVYWVSVGSTSPKSVNSQQLFGRDDVMLLRSIDIKILANACVNSLEFNLNFS